jgi:hypothetical protein
MRRSYSQGQSSRSSSHNSFAESSMYTSIGGTLADSNGRSSSTGVHAEMDVAENGSKATQSAFETKDLLRQIEAQIQMFEESMQEAKAEVLFSYILSLPITYTIS